MNSFKRIALTISSNFNSFVDRVENHEALVAQALREVKSAQAKANVRLSRMQEDEEKLYARLDALRHAETQWGERALSSHEKDQTKALECVRRMNQAKKEIALTEKLLQKHHDLKRQLQEDSKTVALRLDELQRKQQVLATRQYQAEALQALHLDGTGTIEELHSIFDRWETKVVETEMYGGCREECPDTLELEFTRKEDEKELKASLETLRRQQAQSSN